MDACIEAGIHIPQEVAVLGVDKATVQSYGERRPRRRQCVPVSLTPIDELPFFFCQFRLD